MIYDIQKASISKRISAFLFDFIIIAIASVGFAFLISTALGYDSYTAELESAYRKYETLYGVDFDISSSEYNSLSEEEKAKFEEANKALSSDSDVSLIYTRLVNYTLIIVTFGILLSFLIFEFVLPLIIGNGQTLGKKIFGIALMRRDGVKINSVLLFTRSILGKYTVETMLPVLIVIMFFLGAIGIVGAFVILLILAGNLASVAFTKNRCAIHDVLAQTVAVDMQSQLIFSSLEELTEYKKKIHREDAEKREYK